MGEVDWKKPWPSFTPTYHHEQYPAIDPTQAALDCSNKIVLITGAGRGIGQAIAEAFAKAHAKGIILLGRTLDTLNQTAQTISTHSNGKTQTLVLQTDITNLTEVSSALTTAISHFNNTVPDILINNAGGMLGRGPLIDLDLSQFKASFDLNVHGVLNVTQAFLRSHRDHASATTRVVINIPSGAAHLPYAPQAASYACSKLAGAKLMEYLHHEMPAWRVFNMQPGVVDTDLARASGRRAPDNANLAGGFCVWLSVHPKAEMLNGRFVWANWDVDELLGMEQDVLRKDLLTLTLKGWADDFTADQMKEISAQLHENAKKQQQQQQ